jgi:hypothetical protein
MLAPVGSSATKQKLFWLLKLILLLLLGTKHTVEEVKSIFAKEHIQKLRKKHKQFHAKNRGPIHT